MFLGWNFCLLDFVKNNDISKKKEAKTGAESIKKTPNLKKIHPLLEIKLHIFIIKLSELISFTNIFLFTSKFFNNKNVNYLVKVAP